MAHMTGIAHHECSKSELEYDEPKFFQSDISEDYTQYLHPKSILSGDNPLVFEIDGNNDFVDLRRTQLKIKIKISHADGTPIANTKKCAPVNNILHSLFNQVQVSLKDNIVTHSNSLYSYRSYLETLLSYSANAKKTWLKTTGWLEDENGKFDLDGNASIAKRRGAFEGDAEVELKGRLHLDLSFCEKLLPSNLDVRIILTRAKPQFFMLSFDEGDTFKAEITEAIMYVRRVKLTAPRQLAFERDISKKSIRIPINHVALKHVTITSGT